MCVCVCVCAGLYLIFDSHKKYLIVDIHYIYKEISFYLKTNTHTYIYTHIFSLIYLKQIYKIGIIIEVVACTLPPTLCIWLLQ